MNNRIIKNVHGLTVLELAITMGVLLVLLTLGFPSFSSMMDKQRLTGTCQEVYARFTYARSSAVKINQNVSIAFNPAHFTFDEDNDGVNERYSGCLGLHDTSVSGCDCAGNVDAVAQCTVNGRQEVVRFPAEANVAIYNNDVTFAGKTKTTFSARDGTALAGRVLLGSQQWVCKLTLSNMGRVRFSKTKAGAFVVPKAQSSALE